jgi:signal transduction histidine kinase
VNDGKVSQEVLSELAHDLGTPLAVIVGYAELIERRSEEAGTREAAGNILEAARRLRAAVDGLLRDPGAE